MKIYVLGDSISIDYGPYLEKYIGRDMSYSRKGYDEVKSGSIKQRNAANGGDSNMVLNFLRDCSSSGGIDTDLLLLNCGLHDIKRNRATKKYQVDIKDYANNLSDIIDMSKSMSFKLIWIRTTPCDENIHNQKNIKFYRFSSDCEKYNAVADRIMRNKGIPIIDLHSFTLCLGNDIYCDHVHFNDIIRRAQAAYIAGWLGGFNCGA